MNNKFLLALTAIATLAFPLLVSSQSYASPIDLGTAGNFAIMAETGVSAEAGSSVVGDVGVLPIASSALTGFGLTMDSSNIFSTSSKVTGKVYAADYANPTPKNMNTAVIDMRAAYTDAAGRKADFTEWNDGILWGNLDPGVYKWSNNVTIPTDITLSGDADDVWIFQIAGTLDIFSSMGVILNGGAQASNIFWQVADVATLGANSNFEGTILAQTLIAMQADTKLNGRALAQTAVTLGSGANVSNATSVPVPGTMVLLGFGFLGVVGVRRRKKQ